MRQFLRTVLSSVQAKLKWAFEFRAAWLAIALFLLFVVLVFWNTVATRIPMVEAHKDDFYHLLLALFAVMSIHLLDRLYLHRDTDRISARQIESTGKLLDERFQTVQLSLGSLSEANRLAIDGLHMTAAAEGLGLTHIYSCRSEATSDIRNTISRATKKVRLVGVAFAEDPDLREILALLQAREASLFKTLSEHTDYKELDVKILLANPFRSPALFRCFLESPAVEVGRMTAFHKEGRKGGDPTFNQQLYVDCQNAFNRLMRFPDSYARFVRFYGHTAQCWLLIVDDTMFYQPYTFGRALEAGSSNADLRLGAHMPLFKFQRTGQISTFAILEDHFGKLWDTSDTDVFHMKALREAQGEVIRMIFRDRMRWLEDVSGVLSLREEGDATSEAFEKDRRMFTRQPCRSRPPFRIWWQETDVKMEADIKDFSRGGIALRISDTITHLAEGSEPILRATRKPKPDSAAEFIISRLLASKESRFVVREVMEDCSRGKRETVIRLQRMPSPISVF